MLIGWKRRRVMTKLLCALLLGLFLGQGNAMAASKPLSIARSNNDFAIDLYKVLGQKERGNLFFSPYSAFSALLMTYAGAEGKTREQMRRVLRLLISDKALQAEFSQLLQSLRKARQDADFVVGNAVWAQRSVDAFAIDPAFVRLIETVYDGQVTVLDFIGQPEKARELINRWVAKKTKGKIKDLLPPGSITPAVRLVLTNAIYFKGQWLYKFDKKRTAQKPFFLKPGTQISAPMMAQLADLRYGEWATHKLVELPYKGKRISMVVLLPKPGISLSQLETQLTAPALEKWIASMSGGKVDLHLPKFKARKRIKLTQLLQQMGMDAAFSKTAAELLKFLPASMRERARKLYRLYISDVLQQAVIEVSEEGTIAAAATAVIVRCFGVCTTSVRRGPRVFNANRPFLYLIRDTATGAILFMGRVSNPL